jgi:hypothetical protein
VPAAAGNWQQSAALALVWCGLVALQYAFDQTSVPTAMVPAGRS